MIRAFLHGGEAVAAISDGDWFAICILAWFVAVVCGVIVVRWTL